MDCAQHNIKQATGNLELVLIRGKESRVVFVRLLVCAHLNLCQCRWMSLADEEVLEAPNDTAYTTQLIRGGAVRVVWQTAGVVETNPGPTATRKQVWIYDICHR